SPSRQRGTTANSLRCIARGGCWTKCVVAGKRRLEEQACKLVAAASTQANRSERPLIARPKFRARPLILALVSSLVLTVTLFAAFADTLWAAIELAYYRGAS